MRNVRDSVWLLFIGVLVSGAAWGFWKFAGAQGFSLIALPALFYLIYENKRLRDRVSQLESKGVQP